MAINPYFSQAVRSEQHLYEDIVIESLKIYGQDLYYLPRDLVAEDRIFGDDVTSRFNSSYKVEMYIENVEGFDGEGDLFTKFGIEIRDQATFVVSRRRWEQTVKRFDNEINTPRPVEGDLLYLPLSKSLFQIMAVEHEQPFYQLSNLPTYKLRCELFEYTGEDFDTGVEQIDDVERDYAYEYLLTINETRTAATATIDGIDSSGSITGVTLLSGGNGYVFTPTVTVENPGGVVVPVVTSIINTLGQVTGLTVVSTGSGFVSTPSITIAAPAFPNFKIGNTAKQVLSDGTIITGEIAHWSDSDNILKLVSITADRAGYTAPVFGIPIVDSDLGAGGFVQAVNENNQLYNNEQNDDFDVDFIDFSETNPFGDPS